MRLLQTNWYRKGGRYDAPIVIPLRFNQPVRPPDLAPHVATQFQNHQFDRPAIQPAAQTRLRASDPASLAAFDAKLKAAAAAASATAPVSLTLAADWDKKKFPPSPDLVVFETTTAVPPESWVKLTVAGAPSVAGPAVAEQPQTFTIQVEHEFFIKGFYCTDACDPDRSNPIELTAPAKAETFAKATKAIVNGHAGASFFARSWTPCTRVRELSLRLITRGFAPCGGALRVNSASFCV